jgi:hypothetical protein
VNESATGVLTCGGGTSGNVADALEGRVLEGGVAEAPISDSIVRFNSFKQPRQIAPFLGTFSVAMFSFLQRLHRVLTAVDGFAGCPKAESSMRPHDAEAI